VQQSSVNGHDQPIERQEEVERWHVHISIDVQEPPSE
jgi:hypothetical protein